MVSCATDTAFLAGEVQLVFRVDVVLSTECASLCLLVDKGFVGRKDVWIVLVNCLADALYITCFPLTGMWLALQHFAIRM